MLTMKEARRIHRNTQTFHEVSSVDDKGRAVKFVRRSRVPFRTWVRNAWRVDLHELHELPSPKLGRVLRVS